MHCRPSSTSVRKCDQIRVEDSKRTRERPKMRWFDVARKNMTFLDLIANMALDRIEWRDRIHAINPKYMG